MSAGNRGPRLTNSFPVRTIVRSERANENGLSRSRCTMEQDTPRWNQIGPLEDFGVKKTAQNGPAPPRCSNKIFPRPTRQRCGSDCRQIVKFCSETTKSRRNISADTHDPRKTSMYAERQQRPYGAPPRPNKQVHSVFPDPLGVQRSTRDLPALKTTF